MSEKRETRALHQFNRIGFAFLVGIGAAAGMGIRTGSVGIGVVIGIVVFLIFGLELN